VRQALLTIESLTGGFGADVSASAPFAVSAHAVSGDPLTSIAYNTNPGGPISWSAFLANNILPAAPVATTVVDSFGAFQFDVTSIVDDWLSGANTFAFGHTGYMPGMNSAYNFNNPSAHWDGRYRTTFRSDHPGGVQFAIVDGLVPYLRTEIDQDTMFALITRKGSEIVQLPE